MEYCYHVPAGTHDHYLDMLERIRKQVNCVTLPTFADFLPLQKIIAMWSALVSSIDTVLEYAHMMFLPPNVWGDYFFAGGQTFLGRFMGGGGLLYMGGLLITFIQKGWEVSKMHFPVV